MSATLIAALIGSGVTALAGVVTVGAWLFRSGKTWSRIETGVDTLRADVAEIKATTNENTKDISDLKTETAVHKVEIAALKAISNLGHHPTIINNGGQQA